MSQVVSEKNVISLEDVKKDYILYPSIWHQALAALGFYEIFKSISEKFPKHKALNGVSINIKKGELVGVVGRNGAGKTTLLKLVSGNFAPSGGKVSVSGKVQALLKVGMGFNEQMTGLDNLKSALLYNGLRNEEYDLALNRAIEFLELGSYLDQPVRTYSLGMRARLQFAAATAISPEILIVDEVLGAGDIYFNTKSNLRMRELTGSGCTLLLVSHSLAQILQFCNRVIWIDQGRVVMDGKAVEVVKAYEEKMNELASTLGASESAQLSDELTQSKWKAGKISRWKSVEGLKVVDFKILSEKNEEQCIFKTGQRVNFEVSFEAELSKSFNYRMVFVFFYQDGRILTRICSDNFQVDMIKGQVVKNSLLIEKLQFGSGKYLLSVAIYKELDLDVLDLAVPYDLLSRSFEFSVEAEHRNDPSILHLDHKWIRVES